MRGAIVLLVAVAPLALTVLFGWLVMDGHLNLGGGEKDIFIVVPLLLWSAAFMCSCAWFWWRGVTTGRLIKRSLVSATVVLVLLAVVLYAVTAYRT